MKSTFHRRIAGALFPDTSRSGAILPLVAMFVVLLVAMAAFSIDLAYIELAKTELRSATDAAAKAGGSSIVQGKSTNQIVSSAIAAASLNKVAGRNLVIQASDVTLGQSVLQPDGTWQFVAGLQPYQSIQVAASMSKNNANGSLPLFFAPFLGVKSYSPSNVAVATVSACDACLVLDRSNSMCWDQSGANFSYPSPIFANINLGVSSPPQPGSRWISLQNAVNLFCATVAAANGPTKVGVVTWASPIDTNSPEFALTGQTSPGVAMDLGLSSNMTSVYSAVYQRSQTVMLGGTDMASGIAQGGAVLTGAGSRAFSRKVMILMTDGQWNVGSDPIAAAQACANSNITIHCICFLPNADQTTCINIASLTGGKFFYATDAASLNNAFVQLANSLPVGLTQ